MQIRRGQMYYVDSTQTSGSEQQGGRPGIVVSNELANKNSSVIVVVYLTTKPKHKLPTHVPIESCRKPSIALCEQPASVDVRKLGDYIGDISPTELVQINKALKISLELDDVVTAEDEYTKVCTERDMYKDFCYELLDRLAPIGG